MARSVSTVVTTRQDLGKSAGPSALCPFPRALLQLSPFVSSALVLTLAHPPSACLPSPPGQGLGQGCLVPFYPPFLPGQSLPPPPPPAQCCPLALRYLVSDYSQPGLSVGCCAHCSPPVLHLWWLVQQGPKACPQHHREGSATTRLGHPVFGGSKAKTLSCLPCRLPFQSFLHLYGSASSSAKWA